MHTFLKVSITKACKFICLFIYKSTMRLYKEGTSDSYNTGAESNQTWTLYFCQSSTVWNHCCFIRLKQIHILGSIYWNNCHCSSEKQKYMYLQVLATKADNFKSGLPSSEISLKMEDFKQKTSENSFFNEKLSLKIKSKYVQGRKTSLWGLLNPLVIIHIYWKNLLFNCSTDVHMFVAIQSNLSERPPLEKNYIC